MAVTLFQPVPVHCLMALLSQGVRGGGGYLAGADIGFQKGGIWVIILKHGNLRTHTSGFFFPL